MFSKLDGRIIPDYIITETSPTSWCLKSLQLSCWLNNLFTLTAKIRYSTMLALREVDALLIIEFHSERSSSEESVFMSWRQVCHHPMSITHTHTTITVAFYTTDIVLHQQPWVTYGSLNFLSLMLRLMWMLLGPYSLGSKRLTTGTQNISQYWELVFYFSCRSKGALETFLSRNLWDVRVTPKFKQPISRLREVTISSDKTSHDLVNGGYMAA